MQEPVNSAEIVSQSLWNPNLFAGGIFSALKEQIVQDPIFFVLANVILITSLGVVLQRNLVRAGFTLIATLCSLAIIYFMLGAQLIAASQILIYAVGITLVIIFAIMLLSGTIDKADEQTDESEGKLATYFKKGASFLIPFISFAFMSISFVGVSSLLTDPSKEPFQTSKLLSLFLQKTKSGFAPTFETLSGVLLNDYILSFELISVLLLIAFVSAIVLAKRNL